MARTPTVDPQAVVKAVRAIHPAPGAAAAVAREFKLSRVRVSQILADLAPELLSSRAKPKPDDKLLKATADRQRRAIAATVKALKDNPTHAAAAKTLGLTPSGLNSRMRRFDITV